MPILSIVITLAVIGLLLYLVTTYVPMADPIKRILVAVVVICVVIWLLQVFGVFAYLPTGPHTLGPCR